MNGTHHALQVGWWLLAVFPTPHLGCGQPEQNRLFLTTFSILSTETGLISDGLNVVPVSQKESRNFDCSVSGYSAIQRHINNGSEH
jgi:hypothetical protein